MSIQDLEANAPFKFKFASIDENDTLIADSYNEYELIFPIDVVKLEDEWIAFNQGRIPTKKGEHNTWVISKNNINISGQQHEINILAQHHETGIEFFIPQPVIDLAINVSVNVITALVSSFGKKMWDKWKSARKSNTGSIPNRIESSLVIETFTERFNDGRITTSERLEYRGPLDENTVEQHLSEVLSK